jgi:hypothetical protein
VDDAEPIRHGCVSVKRHRYGCLLSAISAVTSAVFG